MKVSAGTARISASTRGRMRNSAGSKPIVESASISSRIFIEPSLGGIGAARPARRHDGDEQDADLAQDQHRDEVDDVILGAEFAEMEEALLGDDGADEKGHHRHDRHGLNADAVEVMNDRAQPEGVGVANRVQEGERHPAEHGGEIDGVARERAERPAERFQRVGEAVAARKPGRGFARQARDRLQEAALALADARQRRLPLEARDRPGAEGVDALDAGDVERRRRAGRGVDEGLSSRRRCRRSTRRRPPGASRRRPERGRVSAPSTATPPWRSLRQFRRRASRPASTSRPRVAPAPAAH